MTTKEQETRRILKQFIRETPKWCKQFKHRDMKNGCMCCGIQPEMMLELADACKELLTQSKI